jgi:hypothetical protein
MASSRHVTPTITFDCTVKKAKTLKAAAVPVKNAGGLSAWAATGIEMTTPMSTSSAVAPNQSRALNSSTGRTLGGSRSDAAELRLSGGAGRMALGASSQNPCAYPCRCT